MTRRAPRAVVVGAVVGLVLILGGCVSRTTSAGVQSAPPPVALDQLAGVTLQIGDQKGKTESVLRASGQLTGTPYQVAFSTFTSGPPEVEAATAGRIDFAVTGNTPPIFGAASDARIKVVTAYRADGSGDQVLVPADSPITTVEGLRGQQIAVAKGSSAHGHLLAQLDRHGLTPDDVKLVFLQPADGLSAFTRHAVAAWAIWDPFTAQTAAQLPVRTLASATGVINGDEFGVAADAALADAKRNSALADFVVRLAKASHWAQEHPDEWARSYAAAVGLPLPVARVAQGRSLKLPVAPSPELIADEQRIADLFARSGQLQHAPTMSDWVDDRYREALAPLLDNPSAHTPEIPR